MLFNRLFLRIITLMLLGMIIVCSSAGQTTVSVSPTPKYVPASGTFTVDVRVGTVPNLKAAKVVFAFDNTILRYVRADKGPICSDLFQTLPPAGTGVNQVEVNQSSNAVAGVSGPGVLFSITFEVLQAGSSPVTISLVDLRDPSNQTIASTPQSGIVSTPVLVSVSPATQNALLQSQVNVDIKVTSVFSLHSPYIFVAFNKNALHYDGTTIGPFMSSNGDNTFSDSRVASGTVFDTVKVDQAILGPGGVSGTGVLFTLKFTALVAGTTPITITKVDMSDINASDIPSTEQSGTVTIINYVAVNAKVFLEGPFAGGSMITYLNSGEFLPLGQPYNVAPWDYAGTEAVASGFFAAHPTIVDWVLIELRSGADPSITVARQAALLRNNGTIVDLDGTSAPALIGVAPGNYYIVVRHRNHLSVMSAAAQTLGPTGALYDFSAAPTQAYGTGSMRDLGSGVYGMWTGDVNASGVLNAADRGIAWNERGLEGYQASDINLDGVCNATDRGVIWNNRGKETQVP